MQANTTPMLMPLSRIRWDKTHERCTEEKEDAGIDPAENTILTAEMQPTLLELPEFLRTCSWDCSRMPYM